MQGLPESTPAPSACKATAIEKRVPTAAQVRKHILDPSLIWKAFIARCQHDKQRSGKLPMSGPTIDPNLTLYGAKAMSASNNALLASCNKANKE